MINSKSSKFIAYVLILFFLINLIFIVFTLQNQYFDSDEGQHMHIMWNMAAGETLYVDFFEHHGPLYPIINTILFELLSLTPSISTFFFFRIMNLVYGLGILIVVYKITKEVTGSKQVGILSSVVLLSLVTTQTKLVEIRPDTIQNLMFLIGFYLFLKTFKEENCNKLILAGIFFGLTMMANFKAIVGVFTIFLYLLIAWLLKSISFKEAYKKSERLLIGILIVFGIFSIGFWMYGALSEFWYYNTLFNLKAVIGFQERKNFLAFFWSKSFLFFILLALSYISLIKSLKTDRTSIKFKQRLLIGISSLFLILITPFLGLFLQWYLILTPLLCVVLGIGLTNFYKKTVATGKLSKTFYSWIIILLLLQLTLASFFVTAFEQHDFQKQQIRNLNTVIENTERDEKVFAIWNCVGHVFNDDLTFYWIGSSGYSGLFSELEGYDVYGEVLQTQLEDGQVRYVSSNEYHLELLSNDTKEYFYENYNTTSGCLWERIDGDSVLI